jgi:hypothetical protein
MKNNNCGKCYYFENEDANGNGWCSLYDWETRCDLSCDEFELDCEI